MPVAASSSGCSQRARWASSASAKATTKPITRAGMTICRCWTVGVSKRSMFSLAQSKQKTCWVCAWQRSPTSRSLKKSLPTSPEAASTRGLIMRPLRRRGFLALGLRRGEELGDDLDREDAGDAAGVVDHRRVLGLVLEQVGEGVAHHVVKLEHRAERR